MATKKYTFKPRKKTREEELSFLNDAIRGAAMRYQMDAMLDEYDSMEAAITDTYAEEIFEFEAKWKVKLSWDNNYSWDMKIIEEV